MTPWIRTRGWDVEDLDHHPPNDTGVEQEEQHAPDRGVARGTIEEIETILLDTGGGDNGLEVPSLNVAD